MRVSDKDATRFKGWAEGNGGEVLPETSENERARIRHSNGVFVIYEGKRGISFSDSVARKAWAAFKTKQRFPLNKRHKRSQSETTIKRLAERDGPDCWFCGCVFGEDNQPTIEHLLSITHGGNNSSNNLVIACESCNQKAGSLSISEKVGLKTTTNERA